MSKTEVIELAKGIVSTYVHHVKDNVKQGNQDYLASGIDTNSVRYLNLFIQACGRFLHSKSVASAVHFDGQLVTNVATALEAKFGPQAKKLTLDHQELRDILHKSCCEIMRKVVDGSNNVGKVK